MTLQSAKQSARMRARNEPGAVAFEAAHVAEAERDPSDVAEMQTEEMWLYVSVISDLSHLLATSLQLVRCMLVTCSVRCMSM